MGYSIEDILSYIEDTRYKYQEFRDSIYALDSAISSLEDYKWNLNSDIDNFTDAYKEYEMDIRDIEDFIEENFNIDESLNKNLSEQAYDKYRVEDKCLELGSKFVEHFDKIYNDIDSEAINHWASEMQAWFDTVRNMKMKYNNRTPNEKQLYDWFITCGQIPVDLFDNDTEAEVYDDFADDLLDVTKDVKQSLKNLYLNESLNEELITRSEAIDKCSDLSVKFIDNFNKIYNDAKDIDNLVNNMQSYYNMVRNIVIKGTNRPLPIDKVVDWFLTNSSDSKLLFKDNLIEAKIYDDFMYELIKNDNVRESLKIVDLLSNSLNEDYNRRYFISLDEVLESESGNVDDKTLDRDIKLYNKIVKSFKSSYNDVKVFVDEDRIYDPKNNSNLDLEEKFYNSYNLYEYTNSDYNFFVDHMNGLDYFYFDSEEAANKYLDMIDKQYE